MPTELTEAATGNARRGMSLPAPYLLALGPAVGMGFARFAYALVLPAMKADLHWTYSGAGALNTANAAGYLVGAMLTPLGTGRWGERRMFLGGLWVTVLGLLLFGAASAYPILWLLRFLVGMSGAFVFITGIALSVTNRGPLSAATAALLNTVGIGLGIMLSGVAVPFVLAHFGREGWRDAWGLLGAAALVLAAVLSRPVTRMNDVGAKAAVPWHRLGEFRPLGPALVAYFLLGAGYITYMTFIFAYVRQGGPVMAALVWGLLGGATMLWPLAWNRPLERWPGGKPMASSLVLVMAGTLLPLLSTARPAILTSAILMAVSFIPVAAITALTRRAVDTAVLSLGISLLTVLFAGGQAVGPLVAGALADRYGLRAGLIESTGVLLIAVVVAAFQREPARRARQ